MAERLQEGKAEGRPNPHTVGDGSQFIRWMCPLLCRLHYRNQCHLEWSWLRPRSR